MVEVAQIFSYIGLVIIVIGVIGNALIVFVSLRSKSHTTFVLLRYLAVADTLATIFWNLNHYTNQNFNFDLASYSMYTCRIGEWLQYSSMQASAWLLVTNICCITKRFIIETDCGNRMSNFLRFFFKYKKKLKLCLFANFHFFVI